jgi:transposase-like protein
VKKKRRKPDKELPPDQRQALAMDVFNGGIVKQVAFKYGVCHKQAYRIVAEFYEWRLVPKMENVE